MGCGQALILFPGLLPGDHSFPITINPQARLVRSALEGALQNLKVQCPAVVCSRRERSLERALPLLSKALAGEGLRGVVPSRGPAASQGSLSDG